MSQSEGPCGPSGATSGSVTEGRSGAQRDTDPLPSSAAAEVGAAAQGRSGVPTGLSTPDAIASANERTGVRTVAPQAPQPVGLHTTGRSEAEEDAGCVTASLARSVPLGSWLFFTHAFKHGENTISDIIHELAFISINQVDHFSNREGADRQVICHL